MKEECLICKAPLEYLETDVVMECEICHKRENSKTRCVNGHHVMVGSALLTAYKNAGGDIDLHNALIEMMNRGKSVPGGACGFWGACGAGISSGMFISIISKSTPLSIEPFSLSHKMTAKSLGKTGSRVPLLRSK